MNEKTGKTLTAVLVVVVGIFPVPSGGQEAPADAVPSVTEPAVENGLPQPVKPQHFAALMENSPFTRSLNLSDLLILTGVAVVDGKQMATLMNKQTKETYVVSDEPNTQGWKMVEFAGNEDLEKIAAKITMTGGEVVTVRYDEWSLKPGEAKPGGGGNGGEISGGGDRGRSWGGKGDGKGFGGGPPSPMFEKMRNMPEEDRRKLFEKMMKIREENPDMSREERGKLMEKEIEKIEKKRSK